ncbi:hypothetical protein TWF106_007006 [Orbilia oligospora]|uniref:Uncharacterized protein n=1 Tax=Orbilia oligospora TaxID=2813651 RepID=A0A7C8QNX4_ORBOL|nr:hypothetical protein TWF106_007006 [Orbilia oligospora]
MAPILDDKALKDERLNVESSDNNTTETTLALVALVFAAIAFLAAFFQALLQYLTSNQRDKCLLGAIGAWNVYTKTRWDLWNWRIVVQYPRLRLDLGTILAVRACQSRPLHEWGDTNITNKPTGLRLLGSAKTHKTFWYLENYGTVLTSGGRALTFWDLTVTQKISWLWFSLRKRRSGVMPFARAGWCNLLTMLEVVPEETMISHYENADVIPSSIDVPIQRMKLVDLCLLCYLANIKDVEINLVDSTINGQNEYIKLNTQEIPGLGKFVTVDGDFEGLKNEIAIASPMQLLDVVIMAKGAVLGNEFSPSLDYFDEGAILFGLARKWRQEDWAGHRKDWSASINRLALDSSERKKVLNNISIKRQAQRFSEYIEQTPGAEWADAWSLLAGSCNPTIIKYLAIMPFAGIWTAVPQKLFFTPYRPHLERQRMKWFANRSASKNGGSQSILYIKESGTIESALITGEILFLREMSDFCITDNRLEVLPEKYSWAWLPNRPVIQTWKSDAVDQALDVENCDLCIPEVVIRLIDGSIPSVEKASDYIKVSSGTSQQIYTTESAILLSLLLVDVRLQAIWSVLEEDGGRFSTLQSKFDRLEDPPTWEQKGAVRNAMGIDAITCDFIALWFELGNRVDLTCDPDYLVQKLSLILDDWGSDDTPCIPVLESAKKFTEGGLDGIRGPLMEATSLLLDPVTTGIGKKMESTPIGAGSQATDLDMNLDDEGESSTPTALGGPSDIFELFSRNTTNEGGRYRTMKELKSRKELVQWVRGNGKNGRSRLDLICKMLVLFQLRIFLMDLSYQCHSDSSDAFLAEAGTSIAVRMI